MATLGELVLKVSATTVDFDKGLDRAASKAKSFSGGIGSTLANPYLAASAAAVGGLVSIASFADSLRETANDMTRLSREATKLGVSTESLAGLEHAATLSGVEVGSLTSALEKLQNRLQGADEDSKGVGNALAAIGLDAAQLRQEDPAQQFLDIANAIAQLPTANDQIAASFAVFGRSGGELVNLLNKGDAGIQTLMADAKGLGLTFNAFDASRVERATAAVNRLGAVWSGIKRSLVIEGAPVAEGLANAFTDAIKEAGGFRSVFASLVEVMVTGLIGISQTLDEIIQKTDKWGSRGEKATDFLSKNKTSIIAAGAGPLGTLQKFAFDKFTDEAPEEATNGINNKQIAGLIDFLNNFKKKAAEATDASKNTGAAFEFLKTQAENAASVEKLVEKLTEQRAVLGMSADAADVYRLKLRGLSEEQTELLDSTLAHVEAAKRQQEALDSIKKTAEGMTTPFESLVGKWNEFRSAIADGAVDATKGGRAIAMMFSDLAKAEPGGSQLATFRAQLDLLFDSIDKGLVNEQAGANLAAGLFDQLDKNAGKLDFHAPAALTEGSKEATSAILRAQRGNETESVQERIERVLKQQLDGEARQEAIQKQMLDALRNPNIAQATL